MYKLLQLLSILLGSASIALCQPAAPRFQAAVARTANGIADTHVLMIGDSKTAGYPYQPSQSWPAMTQITSTIPNSPGLAVYGAALAGSDTRWTLGGGWTFATSAGIGFSQYSSQTAGAGASPLVFAPGSGTFDSFKVYYAAGPGLGAFTATATGGSGTTVNANTGGGSVASVTVAAGSAGTGNAVAISSLTGGPTYILAVQPFLSTAKKIYIHNAGVSGTSAAQWASSVPAMIEAVAPDLCLINLGPNDAGDMEPTANFIAYMQSIVSACQVSGDAIIMTPWPSENPPYTTYLAMYYPALLSLAASDSLPVLDIYGQYSGMWPSALAYDANHPNLAGYTAIATAASTLLTNEALGSNNLTVPGVVGLTQSAAVAALTAMGLGSTLTPASSQTVTAGSVISELPMAGSFVTSGSSVTLVVSIGSQITQPTGTISCTGGTISLTIPGTTSLTMTCSASVN